MTRSALISACAVLVAFTGTTACSDSEASERLRANALATWESALEVALETRDEAEVALQERLQELEPYLEELHEKADQYGAEAREALEAKLVELEAEHLALSERLEALQNAGRETWERLAREAQGELDALKGRVREAMGDSEG